MRDRGSGREIREVFPEPGSSLSEMPSYMVSWRNPTAVGAFPSRQAGGEGGKCAPSARSLLLEHKFGRRRRKGGFCRSHGWLHPRKKGISVLLLLLC